MQKAIKVKLIGIGPNGECLNLDILNECDVIAGGKRLLNFFKNIKCDKVVLGKNILKTLNEIKSKYENIGILASGDPFFYGIGKLVVNIFGKDNVEVYPYLNSIQLLCSKIKLNYEDIVNLSIHGREITSEIIGKILSNRKIGILMDKKNNFRKLAEILLNYLSPKSKIFLGQRIGTYEEKIIETDLMGLLNFEPSELDTLILINEKPMDLIFGINDEEFYHEAGLITKREIRIISIANLELRRDSTVWDIGAGSGSISIEAGRFCTEGKIFAVEKNKERLKLIEENIKKFKAYNVIPVEGEAPEVLENLEKPDRIFIGGFSGNLENLLEYILKFFKGILVCNLVGVEKLNSLIKFSELNNLEYSISSMQVGNLKKIGDIHYFKCHNQVYICKLSFVK